MQDVSDEEWGSTATPPLVTPQKNLELKLKSQQTAMDTLLLSNECKESNTFQRKKTAFLGNLDHEGWYKFLREFNLKVERKISVETFKDEIWDTQGGICRAHFDTKANFEMVAREELLSKLIQIPKKRPDTVPKFSKDSSSLKRKRKSENLRLNKLIRIIILL